MIIDLLILIISCYTLVRASTFLIRSLARISRHTKIIGSFIVFFLMAFATSLPELFIAIISTINYVPQISIGNILGANVLNLTLALGLSVLLFGKIKLGSDIFQKNSLYSIGLLLLPFILILDKNVNAIDGIILFAALFIYSHRILASRKKFTESFIEEFPPRKRIIKEVFLFIISLVLIIASSIFIVFSLYDLSNIIGLPLAVGGAVFLSLLTALPGFHSGIKGFAIMKKDMAPGILITASVINATLIMGIVSIISPFHINNLTPYIIPFIFSLLALGYFLLLSRFNGKIGRKDAYILIIMYILFLGIELITI